MASMSIVTPTEEHATSNQKIDRLNTELEVLLDSLMTIGIGALSKIA
jgi:hypothetical protein